MGKVRNLLHSQYIDIAVRGQKENLEAVAIATAKARLPIETAPRKSEKNEEKIFDLLT
jgi:hypothetical protein